MRVSQTILLIPLLFLGLVSGALTVVLARPEPNRSSQLPAIVFVEAPAVVPGELTKRFPQGSHLARFLPGSPSGSAINLTPGFYAAADPNVSFDADKVLFSAEKTSGSGWQIWEMSADGSGQHQVTNCSADCLQPAYLPRNQMVFTVVSGKGRSSAIYVSQTDGQDAHAITFGPGNFQVETVLRSGRILISAEPSLVYDHKGNESRVFYVLQPDGAGLTLFPGDNRPNIIRTGAEELDDGTVLFVTRQDLAGEKIDGELTWIRPGPWHDSPITPPQSVYWSANILDGSKLVVAKQDAGSFARGGRFSLYLFDLTTRSLGNAIYSNPTLSSVEAVPLEPRSIPREYWSILHPDRDYSRVICLNSYLSAEATGGRVASRIARVRVIALKADHREQTLGDAPVESDGSFYIKVPANRPIRFELLATTGAVIHAQKSWIWARTGEDVGCLGCHESKTLVPRDNWPLALKRLGTPLSVGVPAHSQAANK